MVSTANAIATIGTTASSDKKARLEAVWATRASRARIDSKRKKAVASMTEGRLAKASVIGSSVREVKPMLPSLDARNPGSLLES
jgi:hypothetical protein